MKRLEYITKEIAVCANSLRKTPFAVIQAWSVNPTHGPNEVHIVFAISTSHAENIARDVYSMPTPYATGFDTAEEYSDLLNVLITLTKLKMEAKERKAQKEKGKGTQNDN